MELYLALCNIYEKQAEMLLKNEGINNPSQAQIQAYIIKCCIYEIITK